MRKTARLPLEELTPYLVDEVVGGWWTVDGGKNSEKRRHTFADVAQATNPIPSASVHQPPTTDHRPPFSWRDIFANDASVEIEVGFGKGLFLVTTAPQRPDTNFLGIEIERAYVLFTATRLAKRQLRNVRVICGDAKRLLAEILPGETVQAVHVYFPDPWWKNRHRKRRLLTSDFARSCARVLKTGGVLHLATDVEGYFQEALKLLDAVPQLRRRDVPEQDLCDWTNFARKYRKEGRAIFRADYVKE